MTAFFESHFRHYVLSGIQFFAERLSKLVYGGLYRDLHDLYVQGYTIKRIITNGILLPKLF